MIELSSVLRGLLFVLFWSHLTWLAYLDFLLYGGAFCPFKKPKKASEVFRADARPFRCFNMTLKKDLFPIYVFLL